MAASRLRSSAQGIRYRLLLGDGGLEFHPSTFNSCSLSSGWGKGLVGCGHDERLGRFNIIFTLTIIFFSLWLISP
ncbi:hypothetical protein BDV30DRAFT_208386 [Aspergillus minisclerotigenes]|uniref:Uncharacterized protein n=1 Tax=Aspergillus minisclerotigenes TaxID=656917 RepID=A0A5N6J7N9_9EURO|nr:hypothetical protein BDV30DRAFT_208386 [Aspergillus minisclerotigenes]